MIELLHLDQSLFRLINSVWTTEWLNILMPFLRNKYFWIPLYVFLFSFLIINFGKKGLFLLLFGVLTIAVADTLSSQVIKKTVQRIRPCNDPFIAPSVDLKIDCGGGYSFTSSHATNHFALAFFLIFVFGKFDFGKKNKWINGLLFLWAASIAYAQVYVGVHYPLDVISGAILGMIVGRGIGRIGFLIMDYGFKIQDAPESMNN